MPKRRKTNWFKKIKIRPERFFILSGLVLLIVGTSLRTINFYQKNLVATKNANQQALNQAVNIKIPKIKLNLEVKPGGITDNQWVLDDQAVMVLPLTGQPGEGFNTVLYAHNRPELFGRLEELALDDRIFLEDQNGQNFTYQVYFKTLIKPDQVDKVYSNIPNIISLFTCDGIFDQSRLLIRAKLITS